MFLIVFDHANACASMHSLVEIHKTCTTWDRRTWQKCPKLLPRWNDVLERWRRDGLFDRLPIFLRRMQWRSSRQFTFGRGKSLHVVVRRVRGVLRRFASIFRPWLMRRGKTFRVGIRTRNSRWGSCSSATFVATRFLPSILESNLTNLKFKEKMNPGAYQQSPAEVEKSFLNG